MLSRFQLAFSISVRYKLLAYICFGGCLAVTALLSSFTVLAAVPSFAVLILAANQIFYGKTINKVVNNHLYNEPLFKVEMLVVFI